MNKIHEIILKLQTILTLDPRNLEFIALFIRVLVIKRTCNLAQLCNSLNNKVEAHSNKRRYQRFLGQTEFGQAMLLYKI